MNLKLISTAIALPILAVAIAVSTTGIFTPPQVPGSHNVLHASDRIHIPGAVGPESLVFDPSGGGPYTGVADGRILKWDGGDWVEFAVTSSQRGFVFVAIQSGNGAHMRKAIGLTLPYKTSDLYIADAYLGLQVVGPKGGIASPVVTEVEGQRLRFTNDMDIDEDKNVIYFTDTSTEFYRRQFIPSVLTLDKTGKLMKFDISTKQVTILLRGLTFPNGVSLSKDRSFLLVAETTTRKILRFWLQGPKNGQHDTFAELPGFPDNIRRNPDGEFWVALHSKAGLLSKWASSWSWLGKMILKLPLDFKKLHYFLVGGRPHATAVKLSNKGEILRVLEDVNGTTLRFISEIEERNGKLWIGSVLVPYVGIYTL
ncbi:hypothetical protein CASFOL_019471 [Castilleja foliolosa]|uniref:Strictosidine synthase conserved region domain-containing protein n=1 Tax=Castilleja foliolosa TaxID=1961234 RepID=A0ABD3D8U7_9LAMI